LVFLVNEKRGDIIMIDMKRKKDKLFLMLLDVAANLKEGGQHFLDFKIKEEKHLEEFRMKMKDYEHKGDNFVDEIIMELNNTFITPIEREDALELANHMDEILDGLEECAAHFYMFNICEIDNYMIELTDLINKCIIEINDAIDLLSQKKLTKIRQHSVKIKEYEEKCDHLSRMAIKELFDKHKDVIRLIQYKEIYEILENTADECQRVGKVLDRVVMKNA
jgi:predicted phosphate transport protein (TIGR00153 family)